jgi:hypothetical protein
MKLLIFAVRDRATDQFGNPMFLIASGQAIRSFTDEVNRAASDNQLYQHPDDFDLYALGSFETTSGMFDVGVPEQVAIGKMVKVRES